MMKPSYAMRKGLIVVLSAVAMHGTAFANGYQLPRPVSTAQPFKSAVNSKPVKRTKVVQSSYGYAPAKKKTTYSNPKPAKPAMIARRMISPSAAYRAALNSAPGAQGLGVRYHRSLQGYIVRLRSAGRVYRVFVDGRTGRVSRR